ncbi:MAG: hypothetical protein Unbinned1322contig1000_59 [Prokaryotic dsDNA virus sp.]|nr:hypothetical protein [Aequorivita sp.]QDP57315.1 MAG: hypothetical protein Unbinned1322contig1000_59 [Prokaryotic dsDNA virus sp.]|tara:strand:+ start:5966 stop:6673 length:708 start_codon:yes stop_codon:yes gene_type:complete
MKWMKKKYMLQYPEGDTAQTTPPVEEPAAEEPGALSPATEEPTTEEPKVDEEKPHEEPQTTETPAATDEPAAETPAEEFEEFEITLAEDSILSEDQFNGIVDLVEKAGMNEEQAKAFITQQESLIKSGAQQVNEAHVAQAKANREALVTDPLYGGTEAGFNESLKVMSKPVEAFGDEQFNELLRSDIGNHPALGRFLFKLGKAMESEGFHGKGGKTEPVKKSIGETLYPTFYEKA